LKRLFEPIGLLEAWLAIKQLEAALPRWRAEVEKSNRSASRGTESAGTA
jgi:hypothetical protein